MKIGKAAFLVMAGLLTLLVALFPAMTVDAIAKVISKRALLEPGNFVLIMFLEIARACTTVMALFAAVILMVRCAERTEARTLIVFVLFLALTYEKIFATALPGPMQERLTMWLLDHDVRQTVLAWVFGPTPWTLWPALAGILHFSAVFPRPHLTPELIDASGARDRQGMMRGAGMAGADIGAVFRSISKQLLLAGAFRPAPLWLAAIALIALTTALEGTARLALLAIVGSVGTGIVITNLRAGLNAVEPEHRARARWPMRGFALAAALLLLASLPLLVVDIPAAAVPALMAVMIAAAITAACLVAVAVWLSRLPPQQREVLV